MHIFLKCGLQLALLLSLISSSVLLHVKLVPSGEATSLVELDVSKAGIPMATAQMIASLITIAAGTWEYYCGIRDLRLRAKLSEVLNEIYEFASSRMSRAFLVATK
jgi:hypothetical protein